MAQVVGTGTQKSISQTKEALLKSYQKRLKDDIKSMVDNYVEILKIGKVRYKQISSLYSECSSVLFSVRHGQLYITGVISRPRPHPEPVNTNTNPNLSPHPNHESITHNQGDANNQWTMFASILKDLESKHIPLKKSNKCNKKAPWMSYKAVKLVTKKHKLYKKYKSTSPQHMLK